MDNYRNKRCHCKFSILQTNGSRKWYEDTAIIKEHTHHGLFFVKLDNPIGVPPYQVRDVYVKPENLKILK